MIVNFMRMRRPEDPASDTFLRAAELPCAPLPGEVVWVQNVQYIVYSRQLTVASRTEYYVRLSTIQDANHL